VLVGWRVEDGQDVAEGQPLAEVETSKSVDEIPAPAGGVVRQAVRPGESVRVGAVIAFIGPSVEAIEAYLAGTQPPAPRIEEPGTAVEQPGPHVTAGR